MKKIFFTITCFAISMLSFGQHGNSGTPNTSESYGLDAGISGNESNYFGTLAGSEDQGKQNIFIGFSTGQYNKGKLNVLIGNYSAWKNQADQNVMVGYYSGHTNYSGYNNTFLGYYSGNKNYDGSNNSFLGSYSGNNNLGGEENTFIGYSSGAKNQSGNQNTYIGSNAGAHSNGNRNIFVGFNAGIDEYGSDKLYIENSNSLKPLIYGDFKNDFVTIHGKVGVRVIDPQDKLDIKIDYGSSEINGINLTGFSSIGIDKIRAKLGIAYEDGTTGQRFAIASVFKDNTGIIDPLNNYEHFSIHLKSGNVGIGHIPGADSDKLTVNGKILCEEIEVIANVTPDYVFEKYYNGFSTLKSDYEMPTLEEIEVFTKANHHLPEVPSASEMQENGMHLKDMTTILLQKVEELTLYTIEQEKRIKALEAKLKKQ